MQARAQEYYVPDAVYSYPDVYIFNTDESLELKGIRDSSNVRQFLTDNNVQRGDIVVFCQPNGPVYRNDYRFIYDGQEICPLCFDGPKRYYYGIVPCSFPCITEFPVDYWLDVLHAWRLVWLPYVDTMKAEVLANAITESEEDGLYHSFFYIENHRVELYILSSEGSLEEILDTHIADFLNPEGTMIAFDAVNHGDPDIPQGPNIVHIVNI